MRREAKKAQGWREAWITGTTAVGVMLPVFLMVPLLLQQAGMHAAGSVTALAVTSIVGTLIMAWRGLPYLVLPSMSIAVWLVWIVMLAGGLNWQLVLAVQAAASLAGLLLWLSPMRKRLPRLLPQPVRWAVPAAVGVMLVLYGLVTARIVVHSPWAVTMLGSFQDPRAYLALTGILVTVVLLVRHVRMALLIGGVVTATLALIEGFWVLPDAPFLFPEGLDHTACMLAPWAPAPKDTGWMTAGMVGLVLVLVMSSLGWSMAETICPGREHGRTIAALFGVSLLGACLGCLPVTIAPAVVPEKQENPPGFGEKEQKNLGRRTALVMAFWIPVLLGCAPAVRSMAEFPVMSVPVLTGLGFLLLVRQFHFARSYSWDMRSGITAACIVVLALSWNLTAALGCGILAWVFLGAAAGIGKPAAERSADDGLSWAIRVLALVYLVYFIFADI